VVPDLSIVTSGHDVSDARLHRVAAACVRAGLLVEVLALGDSAAAPEGVSVRTRGRGSVARRAVNAMDFARRARGRVVLAMDPDSLLACLAIGRLRRGVVVADVHEDYLSLLRDRQWASGAAGRPASAVARFATWAAARADLTVVADEHVPPTRARARMVVRNLPDLTMLPGPSPRDETPRALYVGDVRESRGLWHMLDVMDQAVDWHLDVVGHVAAADQGEADRRLRGSGLAGRVRFHGRMPPEQAWTFARGAWCGLVMLKDTPAFRDAMPSKLFEYLACGLGVLVTDLPRQRELVERIGAGRVVDNGPDTVRQSVEQLQRWADHPVELDVCRANATRWAASKATSSDYDGLAIRLVKLASARG
jgi:glycosyltransferase involved in cell wall biosynthesis